MGYAVQGIAGDVCKAAVFILFATERLACVVDPRAVAVSRYGWLKTSYAWLAG